MDTSSNQPTIISPGQNNVAVPTVQGPKKSSKGLIIFVIVALLISVGASLYIWLAPGSPKLIQSLPSPVSKTSALTLDLQSPKDGELSINNEVLIKGKTLPGITVAIFTENDEATVESNQDGSFESSLKLSEGINSVTVTAFNGEGEEKSTTIDVVYDTET